MEKSHCDEHNIQCKSIKDLKENLTEAKSDVRNKVPIWVFSLAVTLCLITFGVTGAWIKFVQGQSEIERKNIIAKRNLLFEKYEGKVNIVINLITDLRLDVAQMKQILKQERLSKRDQHESNFFFSLKASSSGIFVRFKIKSVAFPNLEI